MTKRYNRPYDGEGETREEYEQRVRENDEAWEDYCDMLEEQAREDR